MSERNCRACNDIRENSAEFYANGVNNTVCTSLKNNTGFSPSNSNDNCTDLDLANDCLIGNMESEVDAYEVCDWKQYIKRLVYNIWSLNKAMICSMCGMWANVKNVNNRLDKHDCMLQYAFKGDSFKIGEATDGDAYAVAGKGISFLNVDGDGVTSDISLTYIAGGLLRGTGSYRFYKDDFEDKGEVGNFDAGTKYNKSKSRKGNPVWSETGRPANGGELICEFRIKKSSISQVKNFYTGFGQETGGGAYHVTTAVFDEGSWAYGQHGRCDSEGNPGSDGYSGGHKVPSGWIYIQLRMTYIWLLAPNGGAYTPRYFMGIRMNQDKIEC